MIEPLLSIVLLGAACQDLGLGGPDVCDVPTEDLPPATVAEPATVPDYLADPPAARLSALDRITYGNTVSVTDFGVRGDGKTDNTAALQNAIDRASAGTTLVFPASQQPYVLRGMVRLRSNVGLRSDGGATLDTRANEGSALLLRDVTGVEIAGLRFIGPQTPDKYSRAVDIRGSSSKNLVRDSYFRHYHGGAIFVQASDNTIRNNTLEEVNNSPEGPGADYGSIHLLVGHRNVIVDNVITDFDYSGISLYASDDNRIAGNVVRARAGFPEPSMGIYILAGSSGNLVEQNDVSLARNECIVLISNSDGGAVERNVVRDNKNADCPYAGISLQKNGSYDVRDNLIVNNRVEAFGLGNRHIDHAILVLGARNNLFLRNSVQSDGKQIETGIRNMENPAGNIYEENRIEGVSGDAVIAMGTGSRWIGNTLLRAERGIFMTDARDAVVSGNVISGTRHESIRIGSGTNGARVHDNTLDRSVVHSSGSDASIYDNEIIVCR